MSRQALGLRNSQFDRRGQKMRIVAVRKWRLGGTQSVTNDTNVSNSMPGMQQPGLQCPGGMSSLWCANGYHVREARFQRTSRISY